MSISTAISIAFDREMDASSMNEASFLIMHGGNQVAGHVTASGSGATFVPAQNLPSEAPLRAIVTTAVRDASRAQIANEISWTFRTADVTEPRVVATIPIREERFLALQTPVRISFSEAIDSTSVSSEVVGLELAGSAVKNVLVVPQGSEIHLQIPGGLLADREYEIVVKGGAIRDLAGNLMKSAFRSNFRTTEFQPPVFVGSTPGNGEFDVDLLAPIEAQFSEVIDPASVSSASLRIEDSQGVPISAAFSFLGDRVQLFPQSPLPANSAVRLVVDSALRDLAGNFLTSPSLVYFSTRPVVFGNPAALELDSTGDAIDPAVAVNSSGSEAIAVWRQRTDKDGDGNIGNNPYDLYSSWRDGSGLWTSPQLLEADDSGSVSSPSVAFHDVTGKAIAIWTQSINGASTLFASHFDPSSGWGTPRPIFSGILGTSIPRLAFVPGGLGDAFVGYWHRQVSGNNANEFVRVHRFDAVSDAWLPAHTLDAFPTPAGNASADRPVLAAAADGTAYAVWREVAASTGNKHQLYASAYDAIAGIWKAPFLVGQSSGNVSEYDVALGGDGSLLLVWTHTPTGAGAVRSLHSAAFHYNFGGNQWVSDFPLTALEADDTGHADGPDLAMGPLGEAKLVWVQGVAPSGGTSRTRVYTLDYDSLSHVWNASGAGPQALDDDASLGDSADARIASGPAGTYFALWSQVRDDLAGDPAAPKNLHGRQFGVPESPDPATAYWRVIAPIEMGNTGDAQSPVLGIDGAGRKVVVWSQFDGNAKSIYMAEF